MEEKCKNCSHYASVNKHPSNKEEFKGNISDKTGIKVCTVPLVLGYNEVIVVQDKNSQCEMFNPKKR